MICSIVRGEVMYGLERMPEGRKRRDFVTKARNLLQKIPWEQISAEVGDFYARLKRDVERRGIPLYENDLWIAATAMNLGAILVTSDDHFKRIQGLTIEDWAR